MKEKLIIFGTGHLVKEIIDFVHLYDLYDIIGFTVNQEYIKNDTFNGLPVYPAETLENHVDPAEVKAFIAVSWYQKLCKVREEKFNYLKNKGFHFANLIAPDAVIKTDDIGEGNWINEQVYIGYNAKIGSNNVFAHRTSVAHYDSIGDHNFIGVQANILGHVKIGNRCFIGSSSLIFNGTEIGSKCVIGAGSVVRKPLPDHSVTMAPKCVELHMNEEAVESMIDVGKHWKPKKQDE